ncbi:MAG: M20/M25/M40 family metallo-hydrolase [Gemmatimonadota bacterium]
MRREARDILQQLIEINTTHAKGSTTPAARALADRFTSAGFPAHDVSILGQTESANRNLVVRYRGRGGKKPLLLIAHLDVVEALPQDWTTDPFKLVEKDGYFYGRGTSDNKGGAATLVSAALRLKREKFVPDRDLILAFTAGEESGGDYNGIEWLIKNFPEVTTAEYCINVDAGEPQLVKGTMRTRTVQVAEKVSLTFALDVKNPGGHSSLPVPENAIYRLADGLRRVATLKFPARLSELTQTYFTRSAALETGPLAADLKAAGLPNAPAEVLARLSASPFYNAMLRTTCVATMLEAGHAINALPQRARAVVNCRMHPLDPPDSVEAALRRAVADSLIAISRLTKPYASPPSALNPGLMSAIEAVSAGATPGVPVIPYMEMGGTDSRFLRNAGISSYGVSGIPGDVDDVRAHGKDERILVSSYYQGAEFVYRLMKQVAGGG